MKRPKTNEPDFSHEGLRRTAVRWLTVTKRCSVVLSEMVSAAWETPDAIGWHSNRSILVECKASRGDFFRNKDKPTIRADRGMGTERYFLVPHGLVTVADMDDYEGYGLLWAEDNYVRVKRPATPRETNHAGEVAMLVSALRRVRTREFLTINVIEDQLTVTETVPGTPTVTDPLV